MNLPRNTTPLQRRRGAASGWLDPSSAWVRDEGALLVPASLEPYDWTLDDETASSPPLNPPSPPVRNGATGMRRPEPKAEARNATVPIKTVPPVKPIVQNRSQNLSRPKRSGYAVLLLLLSALTLFIFAYVTQKHGS
jgi:hypothetical protein